MSPVTSLRKLRSLAAVATALILASGCVEELPTTPDSGPPPETPPVLPPAETLTFDFNFFQEPPPLERASKHNFFNAFVRVVVVKAVTHLVLTPPVAAFSLALHTVPSPQPDGSYIWVYTWVHGEEEAQVRLRGMALDADRVDWQMRISSTVEGWDQELWFEGQTRDDGEAGLWTFYDLDIEERPEAAELEPALNDHISMTIHFAIDAVHEVSERHAPRDQGPGVAG